MYERLFTGFSYILDRYVIFGVRHVSVVFVCNKCKGDLLFLPVYRIN